MHPRDPAPSPRRRRFPGGRGARRTAILTGTALAVVAAPLALAAESGTNIRGGKRNPGSNPSVSYHSTTEIIAETGNYGTRQSNKGTGGGAIYGCRSPEKGQACIAGDNLKEGHAFSFSSAGKVGGVITLSNTSGAPLTTNARGVATGFNANFLEGHEATEFLLKTEEAPNAAQLGGKPAASYAQTGQLMFADVGPTGALGATRGATAATASGQNAFTVTFSSEVSKCALTASPVGAALTEGSIGVAVSSANPDVVEVNAPSPLLKGFNLQIIC